MVATRLLFSRTHANIPGGFSLLGAVQCRSADTGYFMANQTQCRILVDGLANHARVVLCYLKNFVTVSLNRLWLSLSERRVHGDRRKDMYGI